MVIAIVTLCRMQFGNTAEFNLLVETIVAGRGHAFSSFAFTGANDEKVGLFGALPRVASASRTYPGLSSVALPGLGIETDVLQFNSALRKLALSLTFSRASSFFRGCELSSSGLTFRMTVGARFAGIKDKIIRGLLLCVAITGVLTTTASIMTPPETKRKMEISSSAFKDGHPIPSQYTCDGGNISPPLTWKGAPANTESFVLIVDDPDSPTGIWTHWTVFNVPSDVSELAEDFAKTHAATPSAKDGVNSFKKVGYGGPCPPAGKPHRYFFKIYALDIALDLQPGASRKDLEAAMTKHILAIGQLMGTYQRK
jgi:Raf kinase inhibitor-like YbhB/YbcL family protein